MNTSGEEGKLLTHEVSPTSHPTVKRQRVKFLLGTVLVLCVTAALVATVAVASQHREPNTNSYTVREVADDVENVDVEDSEPERAPSRVTRLASDHNRVSCSSTEGDTTPAAHIGGTGDWERNKRTGHYDTQWDCESYTQDSAPDAYVSGGMCFLQTDQSLYVPKCGYYQIYSQVLFKVRTSREPQTVFHKLNYDRNCSDAQDPHATSLLGYNTIGPNYTKTADVTTHTTDVVKLCHGGRVWISIPLGRGRAACCPNGGGSQTSTFFGAVLVSEDNCHWPPPETLEMD